MHTFKWVSAALAVGILAISGGTWLRAQQPGAKPVNVDGKVLRNAGAANDALPGSWLSYGRNQNETRYSTLKQINDTNAKRLGLAWTYVVGAGGGNQEGTPLMWNNTLYGITTWSVVYALDARTGKELWRWDPEVNQTAVRPKICCGIVNRGIAIYNGMIIAPVIDGRLQALDAITGKPIWESRVAYPQDLYTLTMAPRIAGGKVIIGAAGGDKPTRGFFAAFDAATGHQAWKFYTVPGNPRMPPENDAMKAAAQDLGRRLLDQGRRRSRMGRHRVRCRHQPGLRRHGQCRAVGAEVPRRAGRGQPVHVLDPGGGSDNRPAQVAFPDHPNDNWDFDSVQQLMLLDLNIKGKQRKVITQAAKNGFFYVLDRVTGEFISGAPYVKMNWARGFDAKGRPIVNPEAYYDKEPDLAFPTGGGAHNWSPMSYNPTTGLRLHSGVLLPFTYAATDGAEAGQTGSRAAAAPPKPIDSPAIGPPRPMACAARCRPGIR